MLTCAIHLDDVITFYHTAVKRSFGIPTDLKASNDSTLQMVWGPGNKVYEYCTSTVRVPTPLLAGCLVLAGC